MFDASGKKEERASDPCPCRLPSMIDRYPWDQLPGLWSRSRFDRPPRYWNHQVKATVRSDR